jgi:hypothetical protein
MTKLPDISVLDLAPIREGDSAADADELMLTGQIFDHADRLRSFELVARVHETMAAEMLGRHDSLWRSRHCAWRQRRRSTGRRPSTAQPVSRVVPRSNRADRFQLGRPGGRTALCGGSAMWWQLYVVAALCGGSSMWWQRSAAASVSSRPVTTRTKLLIDDR